MGMVGIATRKGKENKRDESEGGIGKQVIC